MPDGALSGFSPFAERNEPFIAAESDDFLVVFKPAGMHSAPLPAERKDAFPSRPTPGVDLEGKASIWHPGSPARVLT